MPIEKTTAYKVGDRVLPDLRQAQVTELRGILSDGEDAPNGVWMERLLDNRKEIIAILSMEDDAPRPRKPRKDKGKRRIPTIIEHSETAA